MMDADREGMSTSPAWGSRFSEELHPELAEGARDLLPTISRLEDVKVTKAWSSHGYAMAGLPYSMQLGGFRVIRELGRGGMGVVYEAEDHILKRRVALKVLGANIADSAIQLQRFRNEAEAAARLHHPHIVPVFGTGDEQGLQFYVMQYIDGMPLSDLIDRLRNEDDRSAERSPDENHAEAPSVPKARPWRDWSAIAKVVVDLADALAYAHGQGVLHRDIKPANVLVDHDGDVWIGDFGLAKLDGQAGVTNTGDLVGTLRYMAPEQLSGQTDARSDIYSLGLTMYELLTLQPAFSESEHGPLIIQKTTVAVPSPRSILPAIPRDLETIALKTCALEPAHRYQTASELAEDLRCYLEDRPIRARRVSPVERLARWSRRNPLVAGLAGVAAFLMAAVAIVFAVGNQRTNDALDRAVNAARLADAERERAEGNLQRAVRALDEIMKNVSERGIPQTLQVGIHGEEGRLENVTATEADAELLQSLLHFFDEFASENRANLNAKTATALQRIGAIQERLGKLPEAERAFLQAVEIYKKLASSNPREAQLVIDLATTWNQIGTVRSREGNVRDATQAHISALDVLESSLDASASDAGQFKLAETLILLGSVGSRAGGGEVAHGMRSPPERRRSEVGPGGEGRFPPMPMARDEALRRAVMILKGLLDHDPGNSAYQFALAKSHRYQIRVGPQGGHRDEDVRWAADESVRILRALVSRFPNSPNYAYELAYTLSRAAQRVPDFESHDREIRLREALQLALQLVGAHPQIPEYQALTAGTERRLGEFAHLRGEVVEARERYRRALDLYSRLSTRYPSVSLYQTGYAQTLSGWADVQRTTGEEDAALQTLARAVEIAGRSASMWVDDPMFRDFLAHLRRKQRDFKASDGMGL